MALACLRVFAAGCCAAHHSFMHREASIVYVARDKMPGVPHHAKAGNINSALLKSPGSSGEFILVLDCDMVLHPDFLLRTLPHFYWQPSKQEPPARCSRSVPCGKDNSGVPMATACPWVLKDKAAFVQTPQVRLQTAALPLARNAAGLAGTWGLCHFVAG